MNKLKSKEEIANILIELTNKIGFDHSSASLEAFGIAEDKLFSLRQQDRQVIREWAEKTKRQIQTTTHQAGQPFTDEGYCHALTDLTHFLNSQEVIKS